MQDSDCFVRFHFPELAIRGAWVHLDTTYRALCAGRDYPPAVSRVLGEMASITALMAGQLKHPGRLTFQMRDPGPINLLVMDCTDQLGLRGTAQWNPSHQVELQDALAHCFNRVDSAEPSRLVMTLDAHQLSTHWQSHVPLTGHSLSSAFTHYLEQSEQQPTQLFLAANGQQAAGVFLQQMPGADDADPDGWNRLCHLFATLTAKELYTLDPARLLTRLFPEELISLSPAQAIHHAGERDWGKVHNLLRGLGQTEVESILKEHGSVVIHDDLSNQTYQFDAADIAALFSGQAVTHPDVTPTLH